MNTQDRVSQIEIDLLMFYYMFSDQYGKVRMPECKKWVKDKMGISFSDTEFTVTQEHVNILIDRGVLPDTNVIFDRIKML